MKKKNIILTLSLAANIILLIIIFYAFTLFLGTGMKFPNKPTNENHIIKEITKEVNSEEVIFNWSMDTNCEYIELQYGEKKNSSNSDPSWGGYSVDCIESEGIYNCQSNMLLLDMKDGKDYQAQVHAYECENGKFITSSVYEFSK
jgi:hypothetical protein